MCQCPGGASDEYIWPSGLSTKEYIQHVVEYLSLVDGFNSGSLSNLYAFCEWKELVTDQIQFEMNAKQEYSQTLLAAGIVLMNSAAKNADRLLADRDVNDSWMKEAYTALLQAAGVFDACVKSLGQQVSTVGAKATNLTAASSVKTEVEHVDSPTATEMDAWRKEQANAQVTEEEVEEPKAVSENVAGMERYPDLANAALAKILSWISLANAQELTVFRAASRDESGIDYTLLAKLASDIVARYNECLNFAKNEMKVDSSELVKRMSNFCDFKAQYYQALAVYYMGVSEFEKKDAAGCVQSIANFTKAKELIKDCVPVQTTYTSSIPSERGSKCTASFNRAREIITRDLDISTEKNRTIYYEPIPEPIKTIPSIGLVKPIEFPQVPTHSLWTKDLVAAFDPTAKPNTKKKAGQCKCLVM